MAVVLILASVILLAFAAASAAGWGPVSALLLACVGLACFAAGHLPLPR